MSELINQITEDEVKKIALSCLKGFYKFYPRKGPTECRLNQKGGNEIIADGYLSFQQEDGSIFTATFEATSLRKRNEVLYRVEKKLLIADCLALSFLLVFFFMAWQHIFQENYWLPVYGLFNTIAFMVAFVIVVGAILSLFIKSFRRYRYIYAIEQFKRYYANDQWIAVVKNVFKSRESKHYQELIHQCVYNGFGLILIDEDRRAEIKVAPSRIDLFDHKRQILEFRDIRKITKNLPGPKMNVPIKKYLPAPKIDLPVTKYLPMPKMEQYLPVPVNQTSVASEELSPNRFRRFYGNQLLVILVSIILISTVLFQQYERERLIVYLSEEEYLAELRKNQYDPFRFYGPDSIPIVDTPYLRPLPIDPSIKAYQPNETDFFVPGLVIYSFDTGFSEYDCSRLSNIYLNKYAVEAGRFVSLARAKQIIERLNKGGVSTSILHMECFSGGEDYMIFIGDLFESFEEARMEVSTIRRRLNELSYKIPLSISRLSR